MIAATPTPATVDQTEDPATDTATEATQVQDDERQPVQEKDPDRLYLYLDGAGHQEYPDPIGPADHRYYAIAGFLGTTDQLAALQSRTEQIIGSFFPDADPEEVEIHAYEIMTNPEHRPPPDESDRFWDVVDRPIRGKFTEAIREMVLEVEPILVGRIIDKKRHYKRFTEHPRNRGQKPQHPAVNCLQFLVGKHIDLFLKRRDSVATVLLDNDTLEGAYAKTFERIERLGHNVFRYGRGMGKTRTLERIIDFEFVDSKLERGIQLADLIANYMWRAVEREQPDCWHELLPLHETAGSYPVASTVGHWQLTRDARKLLWNKG